MEELPIPLSRVELYLAKACGMDVTVPEAPESRLEQYLAILAGDTSIKMPAPLSLTEQWLAYILGVTPDPLLAVEGACYIDNQKVDVRYFAVAAGMPGAVLPPAPQNRKEQYFANLNVGPSGVLKYATGTNITLTDVVSGIDELQFIYGDASQNGAPTPDAPVAVNVVTGEQTVTVNSANMYDYTDTKSVSSGVTVDDDGWITAAYNNAGSSTVYLQYFTGLLGIATNTDYAIVLEVKNVTGSGSVDVCTSYQGQFASSSNYSFSEVENGKTYIRTRTTKADFTDALYSLRTVIDFTAGQSGSITFRISVLEDTAITPETFVYQPYKLESYYVSLGSVELCKIGEYQDYIYKSDDGWYIHKSCGELVLNGDEAWVATQMTNNWLYYTIKSGMATVASNQMPNIISDYFVKASADGQWSSVAGSKSMALSGAASPNTQIRITVGDNANKLSDFKTWLGSHNTTVYYVLATATDTKITDSTLISQLNAVNNATLPKPVAYLTVSATSPNLAASIKISYYGEAE